MSTSSDTNPHAHPERAVVPLEVVPPIEPPATIEEIRTHPDFSEREVEHLESLDENWRPTAIRLALRVKARAKARGVVAIVESGSRTDADQLEHYAKGRQMKAGANPMDPKSWRVLDQGLVVTRAFPGLTAHRGPDGRVRRGGRAIDIALHARLPNGKVGGWLRGGSPAKADPLWLEIVGGTCDELGQVWGGRFTTRNAKGEVVPFFDGAHAQDPAWRKPQILPVDIASAVRSGRL